MITARVRCEIRIDDLPVGKLQDHAICPLASQHPGGQTILLCFQSFVRAEMTESNAASTVKSDQMHHQDKTVNLQEHWTRRELRPQH